MNSNCVLLDTNIVSYIFRKDPRVSSLIPTVAGKTIAIASQTLAELHYGALKRGWGPKKYDQLLSAVSYYLVINPDNETAEDWAKIALAAETSGHPMSAEDLWILATAVRWQLPLLTSDKAFGWYGDLVELINI